MKSIIFATLIAVASAASYGHFEPVVRTSYETPAIIRTPSYVTPTVRVVVPILRYSMHNDNYGAYNLETLSGDGSSVSETGVLKNLGDKEGPVNVKSGHYSFVTPEGETVSNTWTADELGFRVSGTHLPVAPAVPALPVELVEAFRKAGSTLF